MPISDDWTIDYDNRRIYHSAGSYVYNLNELYSWLMDELDEATTIDDTIPMTAQTPTEYTLVNGWFIDYVSLQFLEGGGLKTSGWNANTSAVGIRLKAYDASGGTAFSPTDIGETITETDSGDTGTILFYDERNGSGQGYVFIRPDELSDTFVDTNTGYSVSNSSAAGNFSGVSITGENAWANPFTLGTLQVNTQIYIYQNGAAVEAWWPREHIDILLLIREAGGLIDLGRFTVFARQYTKLYDHTVMSVPAGGRTPVPLATFADGNNTTGTYSFAYSNGNGTFQVGERIVADLDSSKDGVITAFTEAGTSPNKTGTIEYYLVGTTQFSNTDAITAQASGTTATVNSAITNLVAGYNDITIAFGSITRDLQNGNGPQPYDVEIDGAGRTLIQIYQYLKYVTGSGSSLNLNGSNGEAYLAAQTNYDPVKTAPFGTFAGGNFFGARGVYLTNMHAQDANSYELIDSTGTRQAPPSTIAVTVNNTLAGDRVSVFLTTSVGSEEIDRYQFYSDPTLNTQGVDVFYVDGPIAADTPDQGVIRVIDDNLNRETRYAYASWTNDDPIYYFTLDTGVTLDRDYEDTDHAYVPYIDQEATGTSVSQSLIYAQNRPVVVRVRIVGMLPFKVTGTITESGLTVTTIRTEDAIYV